MPRLRAITVLSLATTLMVPAALAQNTGVASPGAVQYDTSIANPGTAAYNTGVAGPGTVNYVEGQASLNNQVLTPQSIGRASMAKGETVSTQNGKVEVLLNPGVFLRLGDNSAVTMVSSSLQKTEVQLDHGMAEVEVDQLYKGNSLLVDQGPSQTTLLKNGLYEFDANTHTMRVFEGEAAVSPSQSSRRSIKVKADHELAITGKRVKSQDFNAKLAAEEDPLYSFSKLRANYLGQANLNLAEQYASNSGPGYYPGWMWDPGLYAYTWFPYDGMFFDPFGFGFYSPWYLWGGGFIYPGYGFAGGYYGGYGYRGIGRGGPPRGVGRGNPPVRGYAGGGYRGGGFAGGGFHGGFAGGGGFHGGGGGFHGGGGGGRR